MNSEKANNSAARRERPLSPCVMICTLDDEQHCLGCGRTLAEISRWSLMSVAEQWQLVDDLAVRRQAKAATITPCGGD